MFLASFAVLPSPLAAQDATTPSDAPLGAQVHAPRRFELAQGIGYSYGGVPSGSANLAFGLVLSDRLVWRTGAGVGLTRTTSGTSMENTARFWSASTGLRYYTRSPVAGSFSPVLQFALVYNGQRQTHAQSAPAYAYETRSSAHSLGGSATAGVSYFATDTLAVAIEAGMIGSGVVASSYAGPPEGGNGKPAGFSVGSVVALSLVLRL